MSTVRRLMIIVLAALVVAACGEGANNSDLAGSEPQAGGIGAQVASYDLAANLPQRFLVGLPIRGGGLVVGGTIELRFAYEDPPSDSPEPTTPVVAPGPVRATYLPIAGTPGLATEAPRPSGPGEGGVYLAEGIVFEAPGTWQVSATATVNGQQISVTGTFEVLAEHQVPAAGTAGPRTANLLPTDADAPVTAVDSRAEADGTVPDPELHRMTVAAAIDTGQPTLVVVSTPVFCASRFCGPITDSVQDLARRYDGRANFVHIEVWRDFENTVLNRGAAEWIYADPSVDPHEPWVFLIDRDGMIGQRWDNVTNEQQLEAALRTALG